MQEPRKLNNFSEKRQAWRSQIEKPIGPGMLVTLIPTLILCTFLVLAAPYLKSIALRFLEMDHEREILPITIAEETDPFVAQTPPPNPERVIAKIYQDLYDKEGFDWRKKPEIEMPEEERVEIQKEIKPVPVELPLMLNVPLIDSSAPESD